MPLLSPEVFMTSTERTVNAIAARADHLRGEGITVEFSSNARPVAGVRNRSGIYRSRERFIQLPVPADADDHTLNMIRMYADHESAHHLFHDLEGLEAFGKKHGPSGFSVLNGLADIHGEKLFCKFNPGSAQIFSDYYKGALAEIQSRTNGSKSIVDRATCAMIAHAWGLEIELDSQSKQVLELMKPFADHVIKMSEKLEDINAGRRSSDDLFHLAERCWELVKKWGQDQYDQQKKKKQEQQEQQEQQDEEDGEEGEEGEGQGGESPVDESDFQIEDEDAPQQPGSCQGQQEEEDGDEGEDQQSQGGGDPSEGEEEEGDEDGEQSQAGGAGSQEDEVGEDNQQGAGGSGQSDDSDGAGGEGTSEEDGEGEDDENKGQDGAGEDGEQPQDGDEDPDDDSEEEEGKECEAGAGGSNKGGDNEGGENLDFESAEDIGKMFEEMRAGAASPSKTVDLSYEERNRLDRAIKAVSRGGDPVNSPVEEKDYTKMKPAGRLGQFEQMKEFGNQVARKASKVAGLLQGMDRDIVARRRPRGKLDRRMVSRVAMQTTDLVFMSSTRVKARSVAVSLLIDVSGSMGDRDSYRMVGAKKAIFAMAELCKKLKIRKFEVLAYDSGRAHPIVRVVKSFDSPWHDPARKVTCGLRGQGGTPTGQCMQWAAMRLGQQNVDRRLLFVATDGMPNDTNHAINVTALCRKAGVEVYGFGISCDTDHLFGDGWSVRVDYTDIADVVVDRLAKAMRDNFVVLSG